VKGFENMGNFVHLCRCGWSDPEHMTDCNVSEIPVHLYRHRQTGQLHVALVADEMVLHPNTYIVEESELLLPAGGMPQQC
jgi:hypothetical protein